MHRTLGLMLALLCPVSAQFSQLAATDSGTQVYFVSRLMLKGAVSTAKFPEARLYRIGPDGVTLFAERGPLAPQNFSGSSDGVSNPGVSGDGSLIAFTFNNVCPTDSTCQTSVQTEAELRGTQTFDLGPGSLQLSRNGKWALVTSSLTLDLQTHQLLPQTSTLINLATGARSIMPGPPAAASHTLASDGTVLILEPAAGSGVAGAVGLWKQGQFTPVKFSSGVAYGLMSLSDDAGTLISQAIVNGATAQQSISLVAIDVASGKQTILWQTTDKTQAPMFMGAANNGQTVLYLARSLASPNAGPAYIASVATGQSAPVVLPAGELVTDGTLTGGGDFAFVATTAGRILKIVVASGVASELIPATPYCLNPQLLSPGSRTNLQCGVAGSADDLKGQFLLDNQAMPVLSANLGQIVAQVPWGGLHQAPDVLTIDTPNSSPFQPSQPVNVGYVPSFFAAPAGQGTPFGLLFIKGDWSGLLTGPPGPGDIVFTYMTGLGPVNGPMQTGVPASLTVISPILGTLTCQFRPEAAPVKTLFAGLAPGMVGIYQVAFQMPADAGPAWTGLTCSIVIPGLGTGTVTINGAMPGAQAQSAYRENLP
jgi:uncharacterized protein (TIGR03437 family)